MRKAKHIPAARVTAIRGFDVSISSSPWHTTCAAHNSPYTSSISNLTSELTSFGTHLLIGLLPPSSWPYFSTLSWPRILRYHIQVNTLLHDIQQALFPSETNGIRAELLKINIYSEGGHFVAHRDTPLSKASVGSLVVALPSAHAGIVAYPFLHHTLSCTILFIAPSPFLTNDARVILVWSTSNNTLVIHEWYTLSQWLPHPSIVTGGALTVKHRDQSRTMDFASKFAPTGCSFGRYGYGSSSSSDGQFDQFIAAGQYNINQPVCSYSYSGSDPATLAANKLKSKMLVECGLPKVITLF